MAVDVMIISTHQHFCDSNTPVDADKCFFGRHEAVEDAPASRGDMTTQKRSSKQHTSHLLLPPSDTLATKLAPPVAAAAILSDTGYLTKVLHILSISSIFRIKRHKCQHDALDVSQLRFLARGRPVVQLDIAAASHLRVVKYRSTLTLPTFSPTHGKMNINRMV